MATTATTALVIVPTYNERANLTVLVDALMQHTNVSLLVVDDASPDGTGELADALAQQHPGRIDVMHRTGRRGLGRSYIDGIRRAIERPVDVICQMDADLSHDPAALPALIAAVDAGADLAIGSRYVPGGSIPHWPPHRRAASRWGNRYAGFMLGTGISDSTSGFRVYRAATLEGIEFAKTRANGYLFQIELAYRAWLWGGRTAEVPITFTDRVRGYSKMSFNVVAEEMFMVSWWGLRDRLSRPGRQARKRAKRLAAA
jgi:dolichol-phosphate mannosyltransferase